MLKFNFIKTLTAGVALAMALYPQARAADTGSCGTNCVYSFENGTLTYSVADTNANNGTGKITITNQLFGITDTVENVIVNEGITGVALYSVAYAGIHGVGTANGKLVLPDNFKTDNFGMLGLGFGTVEIGNNTVIGYASLRFNPDANPTIVMSADSNITIDSRAFITGFPNELKIACKGNPDVCRAKFGSSLDGMDQSKITVDYYREKDKNGNIIEEWDANGKHEYSYKIDGAGNPTAVYENGVATYKRTSYTPAEAAAAIKKGNDNKVTLTFK